MQDHISKPIDPQALFSTVERFYRQSEAKGSSVVAIIEKTATDEPVIPTVEGLNTEEGLLRVAGNRKLYLKLLRQFSTEQAEAPAHIETLLQAGDRAAAERAAHTVKGVAGNLGAKDVRLLAGDLEKAIHDGTDSAHLESLQFQFSSALTALLDRLRAALGAAPPPPVATVAASPEDVKRVTGQMAALLAAFDAGAPDCLEANRDLFASLMSAELFGQFERLVQSYAFADAGTKLAEALQVRL